MKIVWDEPKREANLAKHGLDFADLDLAFFEAAAVRPSHTRRFLAFGRSEALGVIAVVFRPLGSEAIAIVSMRPARRDERRLVDEQR